MKILITGYRGFIGQHMVNALKDDHDLTLFDWGDELPELKGYDWCIHLGAISSTTENDVNKVLKQNYDFSRYLIGACNDNGVNLQYASSASVYGRGKYFKEDSWVNPLTPYAWSKLLFDRYVYGIHKKLKIKVHGFRYFNVYGPEFEDHKGDQASPFYRFRKQAEETGVIKLFTMSDLFKRDFVHVSRVVEVHKKFFNLNDSDIWNIGSGTARSFASVAEEIAKEYGAKIKHITMPADLNNSYQYFTQADISKLEKTLKDLDGIRE
jgi:ADP-L-glycero-D-manno-heptose 6-epimerase